MICVTVTYEKERITKFTVSGHAQSAPYGADLVCAAVTAVTVGTVNAITELTKLKSGVCYEPSGGYLSYSVPTNISEADDKNVQLLLRALLVSLQTIKNENQSYIKMVVK